jgi:hypothetical protein
MSHGVDTAVQAVQVSGSNPCPGCGFADSRSTQLVNPDDPMLLRRNLRDSLVGLGDFPLQYTG